jgi:hypothetical protein
VCPSQALWFGEPEEFAATRRGTLVDTFSFGNQGVKTKVKIVVDEPGPLDVLLGRASAEWLEDPFAIGDRA